MMECDGKTPGDVAAPSESFFEPQEARLMAQFLEQGYLIVPVDDRQALDRIRDTTAALAAQFLKMSPPSDSGKFLNDIGQHVTIDRLNALRLHVFNQLNTQSWFRPGYYSLARRGIGSLVGNELAMQRRINLSIQLPKDASSLLPVHSDCWSGDSPYEIVEWLPLVDCYRTKSMFILPPAKDSEFNTRFSEFGAKSAEDLYHAIEPHLVWLEVPYGSVLLFTHTLMHGNRINQEGESRWSMNCRFKEVLSPYWDKRLGEFFEPITTRPLTRIGMGYKLPEVTDGKRS